MIGASEEKKESIIKILKMINTLFKSENEENKNILNKFYLSNSEEYINFIKSNNLYFLYNNKNIQNYKIHLLEKVNDKKLNGYQLDIYNKYNKSKDIIFDYSEKEYQNIMKNISKGEKNNKKNNESKGGNNNNNDENDLSNLNNKLNANDFLISISNFELNNQNNSYEEDDDDDDDHDHDHEEHHGHHHHHHHDEGEAEEYGIGTYVYQSRKPLNFNKFDYLVAKKWPLGVIRSKGLCYFDDEIDKCYLFEQAGRQKTIKEAGMWFATMPEEQLQRMLERDANLRRDWDPVYGDRMIKIVFIGQHLDKAAIDAFMQEAVK